MTVLQTVALDRSATSPTFKLYRGFKIKVSNYFLINLQFFYYIHLSCIFFSILGVIGGSFNSLDAIAKSSHSQLIHNDALFTAQLPPSNFIQVLEIDLHRIIEFQPSVDWLDSKRQLKNLSARILEVTCHIDLKEIQKLEHYYATFIKKSGTVKEHWEKIHQNWKASNTLKQDDTQSSKNKSTQYQFMQAKFNINDYGGALQRERVYHALRYASENRSACPFWILPNPKAYSIHADSYRGQIILETMGSLQYVMQGQDHQIGGAGQGRVLGMYGFGLHWGLALGVEVGGASVFPKDSEGQRTVKAMWSAGLPVMFRYWYKRIRFDTEVAAVMRKSDDNWEDSLVGYRVAQSVGVSALRIFGFLPHFMIWGGYESYYGKQDIQVIRIGTRVGVSWGSF
jgi:hypothetical protein